ncbi:hypothetical protein QFZ35_003043 [Arthrobacter ulcerisalmonis]|nr:helix-turn-helix domain-containing protein [Arthrobacter ulcerisalmonis]MDQ0664545.1 hypothetical protein [Arthrobacter ulcerisalmonis]
MTLDEGLLPQDSANSTEQPNEFFGRDLVAVLDVMIAEAIREIGKPVEQMSRDDRIDVLRKLDQQGVLQVRKDVERIAARLDISRVTGNAYRDEARSQTPGNGGPGFQPARDTLSKGVRLANWDNSLGSFALQGELNRMPAPGRTLGECGRKGEPETCGRLDRKFPVAKGAHMYSDPDITTSWGIR